MPFGYSTAAAGGITGKGSTVPKTIFGINRKISMGLGVNIAQYFYCIMHTTSITGYNEINIERSGVIIIMHRVL